MLIFMTASAQAHVGHLGELAGHSHWLGLGAVVVAGVLAAVVRKASKKQKEEDEEITDGEESAEGAPS